MGSPMGEVLINPLPEFVKSSDGERRSLAESCKQAEEGLKVWGEWWQVHQDRGFGLGFPSTNVVEKINQPTSSGLWDLPPMPFEVELVDTVVRQLPLELRVVAWRWYVSFEQMNLPGCARAVGRDLERKVGKTLFQQWRGLLLVGVVSNSMAVVDFDG